MLCPRCQHENPAGVKFCGECGARLEAVCPACQASNPPSNKFCHECGAPLTAAPPAAKFVSPHLAAMSVMRLWQREGRQHEAQELLSEVYG